MIPAAITRASYGMILVFAVGCTSLQNESESLTSADVAVRDVQMGRLELHGISLSDEDMAYRQLLKERLNVEAPLGNFCGVGGIPPGFDDNAGYNAVMVHEIERRFGHGILQRLRDQANTAPADVGGN